MNMDTLINNTLEVLKVQLQAVAPQLKIALATVTVLIVTIHIVQAILVGALAKEKGYSFFGNFLLGLVFGMFALIYQAGRPVSYERECVMQDRLAIQTAKELYKLQRAREKAQTSSVPKVPVR